LRNQILLILGHKMTHADAPSVGLSKRARATA
jgi:hypothetical protein